MNYLFLKSGALGDASVTNILIDHAAAFVDSKNENGVVTRDLAKDPLPHITVSGLQSDLPGQLIEELMAADTIVIGAAMYNFGIPSALKAYIDHIVRAGSTFQYGANGPEGLIKGKKVIVAIASGGNYDSESASAMDFVAPYLRAVLGFIGITDVSFIRAQGVAFGPEAREAAIQQAKEQLTKALS